MHQPGEGPGLFVIYVTDNRGAGAYISSVSNGGNTMSYNNEPDKHEIAGVGMLTGKSWGRTSVWNAPGTIETDLGIASRVGMEYIVSSPLLVVLITGNGSSYHAPGCPHATTGAPVPVQTAQALNRKPCSHCRPDSAMVTVVAAVIREPRKPNYSALYAALG